MLEYNVKKGFSKMQCIYRNYKKVAWLLSANGSFATKLKPFYNNIKGFSCFRHLSMYPFLKIIMSFKNIIFEANPSFIEFLCTFLLVH